MAFYNKIDDMASEKWVRGTEGNKGNKWAIPPWAALTVSSVDAYFGRMRRDMATGLVIGRRGLAVMIPTPICFEKKVVLLILLSWVFKKYGVFILVTDARRGTGSYDIVTLPLSHSARYVKNIIIFYLNLLIFLSYECLIIFLRFL